MLFLRGSTVALERLSTRVDKKYPARGWRGEKHGDTTAEAKMRRRPTQAGQTSQQRDSGGSIRAVHCIYGWGNGVGPAERRIAILVGRGSDWCGVNFM